MLIVCTANKVRSPLAMEIANSIAERRNLPYCFKSAGIAVIGGFVDDNVVEVLREIGIETDWTPMHLNDYDITKFDEIQVMTERQRITVCSFFRGKGIDDRVSVIGIEDPFARGIDAYRSCRDRLIEFYEGYIK